MKTKLFTTVSLSFCLSFINPMFCRAQEPAATDNYWVLETNLVQRNYTIVRFYDTNHQLIYEERLDGIHLDVDYTNLPKIVILHYSPIKETVVGEPPEIFPYLGCSRLVEPVNRRQVLAAFHGHAHVGTLEGQTSAGVKVFNVAKPILHREGYEVPFYLYEVQQKAVPVTQEVEG